jgi:hypothetical protein
LWQVLFDDAGQPSLGFCGYKRDEFGAEFVSPGDRAASGALGPCDASPMVIAIPC